MTAERAWVLGAPVDRLTAAEALDRSESFCVEEPRRTRLVLTPNPELLMAARRDRSLLQALRAADLALADGVGVVWAARVLGAPVPERIAGIDFMMALLARAAATARGVFLLGTRAEVVAAAAREVGRRFPGLRVVGVHHGYFGPAEADGLVASIASSGADLLFAGLGFPKEQYFLAENRERLGVALAMGVGGSLDVLGGAVARAPAVCRRLGLEWLWRLATDPRRWRRQLALPRFVLAVRAEAARMRRGRGEPGRP